MRLSKACITDCSGFGLWNKERKLFQTKDFIQYSAVFFEAVFVCALCSFTFHIEIGNLNKPSTSTFCRTFYWEFCMNNLKFMVLKFKQFYFLHRKKYFYCPIVNVWNEDNCLDAKVVIIKACELFSLWHFVRTSNAIITN